MNKCKRTAKLLNMRRDIVDQAMQDGLTEQQAHLAATKILKGIKNKKLRSLAHI